MSQAIQDFAHMREVKQLLHFTRATNLGSILQWGLATRDLLVNAGKGDVCNDKFRLDGTQAICLSIGFPNYKLFYTLRNKDAGIGWVVLAINPAVLWELRCAFCASNAASAGVTAIPLASRMTLGAFQNMYGNPDLRAKLGLANDLSTDPQGEVLALDGVPTKYIWGAYVLNIQTKELLEKMYPNLKVKVHAGLFSWRHDYSHWKSK